MKKARKKATKNCKQVVRNLLASHSLARAGAHTRIRYIIYNIIYNIIYLTQERIIYILNSFSFGSFLLDEILDVSFKLLEAVLTTSTILDKIIVPFSPNVFDPDA